MIYVFTRYSESTKRTSTYEVVADSEEQARVKLGRRVGEGIAVEANCISWHASPETLRNIADVRAVWPNAVQRERVDGSYTITASWTGPNHDRELAVASNADEAWRRARTTALADALDGGRRE